eukprot:6344636-Ditylum_brightwellii.AAC.1
MVAFPDSLDKAKNFFANYKFKMKESYCYIGKILGSADLAKQYVEEKAMSVPSNLSEPAYKGPLKWRIGSLNWLRMPSIKCSSWLSSRLVQFLLTSETSL